MISITRVVILFPILHPEMVNGEIQHQHCVAGDFQAQMFSVNIYHLSQSYPFGVLIAGTILLQLDAQQARLR